MENATIAALYLTDANNTYDPVVTLRLSGMDKVVTKSLAGSTLDSTREYSLLLKEFDVENHGQTPVNAEAFLKLKDGTTVTGATCSYSLRTMLERINTQFDTFNQAQKEADISMVTVYEAIMKNWAIENIR